MKSEKTEQRDTHPADIGSDSSPMFGVGKKVSYTRNGMLSQFRVVTVTKGPIQNKYNIEHLNQSGNSEVIYNVPQSQLDSFSWDWDFNVSGENEFPFTEIISSTFDEICKAFMIGKR